MSLLVSHFNYYIVVALMMVGLYIVFASANMVKRLIGLSVFQTSVFLFYISLGKVAGGIPPILPEHDAHGGGHGHGGHDDAGHATAAAHGAAHDESHADDHHGDADGYDAIDEAHSNASEHAAADDAHHDGDTQHGAADEADLHGDDAEHAVVDDHAVTDAHDVAHHDGLDGVEHAAEVLYSNPLPHVLILTAIVVGVATLAVGLALVVRIREAYGTIEDDEINRAEYDADTRGADA